MENEQTRDQVNNAAPTAPSVCVKCCVFFGNPANDGMCSQCYKLVNDTEPAKVISTAKVITPEVTHDLGGATPAKVAVVARPAVPAAEDDTPEDSNRRKVQKNKGKCWSCKKKVMFAKQLTNKCRCEYIFCDEHRLSDRHDCDFGYKESGRELLSKLNPQVVNEKLGKI
ncbi:hypothetical protein SARC_07731 [Sphaeroforma arctica JP610]|uniref:AN1-type domain-containing protein n=1 Tax=Sphaeroforma arctica JP610 TaxID=667725 RepID=A0A0L0FSV4_9EUKA|nr:hypothetical protein SARC_07731 [Sphaeroforma arctica JP610]KNC79892.1 hypothetical protein SARC_07731 [Sphaeroforma arctica JP610]|eukprot:XP_014153794.1 hypothetical protein SARC_07731 [Sphaeroforma arctica JP610]